MTLDGKPLPGHDCVARRIRRPRGISRIAVRQRVLQAERQVEYAALQEAGPARQSDPAAGAGRSDGIRGIQDQFFAAAFIPDGTDISLWDWGQWHHSASNGQAVTEPEAQMAVGAMNPGAAESARVYRAEGSDAARQGASVARGAGVVRMVRRDREAAALRPPMDAQVHSELRLDDRHFHAAADDGAAADPHLDVPFGAQDADGGAGDQVDSGQVQEILDVRSAQAEDERGSDGGVPARGHQSAGKLPADAGAAAGAVGVLSRAQRRDRAAARAVGLVDSRSLGEGSLLHFAGPDGDHVVFHDEDDAARRRRRPIRLSRK